MKRVPHKHFELIREWALDPTRQVQWYHEDMERWVDCAIACIPEWNINLQYRFKPEPKADIVTECRITKCYGAILWNSATDHVAHANLRLTFHAETGVLKSAEVLS